LIIKPYNGLFIHVPKTAGKSVELFFLNLMGHSWDDRAPFLLRPNSDPMLGPERLAHLTAAEYMTCGYLTVPEFAGLFKFSFVRNPWARMVSEFRYRNYSRKYSFKDFLLEGLPSPGMSDEYRHILPQYDFLHNSSGDLLVNFVGRFENLQEDFCRVCEHLEIENAKLPFIGQSTESLKTFRSRLRRLVTANREPHHDSYVKYYDADSQKLVAAMYSKDIDKFGYKFGE